MWTPNRHLRRWPSNIVKPVIENKL
jgi:hypothetical protein